MERATLRIVQTPQFFRAELLRKAYACTYDPAFTDDATVVEAAGRRSAARRRRDDEPENHHPRRSGRRRGHPRPPYGSMKRVFKYRFSRRTLYLSAFYILVLALIGLGRIRSTSEATSRHGSSRSWSPFSR